MSFWPRFSNKKHKKANVNTGAVNAATHREPMGPASLTPNRQTLPLLTTPSDVFRLSACNTVDVTEEQHKILTLGQDPQGKSYAICTVYHAGLAPTFEGVSRKVLISLVNGPRWYPQHDDTFKGMYSHSSQVGTLHRIGCWHFIKCAVVGGPVQIFFLVYAKKLTTLESCPILPSIGVAQIVANAQNLAESVKVMYSRLLEVETMWLTQHGKDGSPSRAIPIAVFHNDRVFVFSGKSMPEMAPFRMEWGNFPTNQEKRRIQLKYLKKFHESCKQNERPGASTYCNFGEFVFVHTNLPGQYKFTYLAQVSYVFIKSLRDDTKVAVFKWLHDCNVNPTYFQEQGYRAQDKDDVYPHVWLENHDMTSFFRHKTVDGVHHFEFRFDVTLAYKDAQVDS